MKFIPLLVSVVLMASCQQNTTKTSNNEQVTITEPNQPSFQQGDIIFQGNDIGQSKAVKLATHSEYSHVGVVLEENDKFVVFEAVEPVKITPLDEWISHGDNDEYVVMRLKNKSQVTFNEQKVDSLKSAWLGKNYDLPFEWSDDELYCSELVWKFYKEGCGIKLCETKQMKDFDLTHPYTRAILADRYGSEIPYEQEVVSPQDIYESELLEQIDL